MERFAENLIGANDVSSSLTWRRPRRRTSCGICNGMSSARRLTTAAVIARTDAAVLADLKRRSLEVDQLYTEAQACPPKLKGA